MGTVHLAEQALCPPLTRIISPLTGKNFSAVPARQTSVLLVWLAQIGQSGRYHLPMDLQLEFSTGKTCASASSRELVTEPQNS